MFESKLNKGTANGYAPLDSNNKVSLDFLDTGSIIIKTGSFATTGSNVFKGSQTITGSISQGFRSVSNGVFSHAEGEYTTTNARGSHAEGFGGVTYGTDSHIEGMFNTTYGEGSHAEGENTRSNGSIWITQTPKLIS